MGQFHILCTKKVFGQLNQTAIHVLHQPIYYVLELDKGGYRNKIVLAVTE